MSWNGLRWSWEIDLSKWEVVSVLFSIEVLSCLVDSLNFEDAAKCVDVTVWGDLIAGQVVVTNESLSWLVYIEAVWEFLSAEEESEGVTTVVGVMNFTNFNSVISQVVVDNVWKVLAASEETEDSAIVVKELFL